jgi:hypothetical protein
MSMIFKLDCFIVVSKKFLHPKGDILVPSLSMQCYDIICRLESQACRPFYVVAWHLIKRTKVTAQFNNLETTQNIFISNLIGVCLFC